MPDKPFCNWPVNAQGLVNVRDAVDPPGGCIIPPTVHGFFVQQQDVPTGTGTLHTGNWKKPPPRSTVTLTTRPKEAPVLAQVAPVPSEAPQANGNAPQSASVAVAAPPSVEDLVRASQAAGGGSAGIVMALIAAVGGGGAIWKYLQSKQRASAKKDELEHQQRMKELEIQQQNDDRHKSCETGREALASKLSALDERITSFSFNVKELQSKLGDVLDKLDTVQDGLVKLAADDEALDERIDELEALKTKAPTKRKSR